MFGVCFDFCKHMSIVIVANLKHLWWWKNTYKKPDQNQYLAKLGSAAPTQGSCKKNPTQGQDYSISTSKKKQQQHAQEKNSGL